MSHRAATELMTVLFLGSDVDTRDQKQSRQKRTQDEEKDKKKKKEC